MDGSIFDTKMGKGMTFLLSKGDIAVIFPTYMLLKEAVSNVVKRSIGF